MIELLLGDCRERLKDLPDCSVDSIVTDPPYELGFMGKSWDSTGVAYDVAVWAECLRVLKHGGHLLAFGGSRTYHRLAVAIEDAGFQIRDQIMWVYGSGFPKSLNVSKSIEGLLTTGSANKTAFKHLAGEQVDRGNWGIAKQQFTHGQRDTNYDETASATVLGKLEPTTDEAKQWDGWGTALKPAHEPIVLARKPLDGTVANNVLVHGVGGINIDGCRVGAEGGGTNCNNRNEHGRCLGHNNAGRSTSGETVHGAESGALGRFPANFIHDGSDEVLELFPDTKGGTWNTTKGARHFNNDGEPTGYATSKQDSSTGSAARFFYCAKANKKDRNEGATNHHPTVKPTDLMRYLCRLITPPNGVVLDPFTGSGSTGKAAVLEGFSFIGVEQSEEYIKIAQARIESANK